MIVIQFIENYREWRRCIRKVTNRLLMLRNPICDFNHVPNSLYAGNEEKNEDS